MRPKTWSFWLFRVYNEIRKTLLTGAVKYNTIIDGVYADLAQLVERQYRKL